MTVSCFAGRLQFLASAARRVTQPRRVVRDGRRHRDWSQGVPAPQAQSTAAGRAEPQERSWREGIAEHGWLVIDIQGSDNGEPGFRYTVGLTEHDLPELITYGLARGVWNARPQRRR